MPGSERTVSDFLRDAAGRCGMQDSERVPVTALSQLDDQAQQACARLADSLGRTAESIARAIVDLRKWASACGGSLAKLRAFGLTAKQYGRVQRRQRRIDRQVARASRIGRKQRERAKRRMDQAKGRQPIPKCLKHGTNLWQGWFCRQCFCDGLRLTGQDVGLPMNASNEKLLMAWRAAQHAEKTLRADMAWLKEHGG